MVSTLTGLVPIIVSAYMIIARRARIVILFALCFGGFRVALNAQRDAALDPKISFRSLMILQEEFFSASDDKTKAKLARSVLDVSDDLVRGPMKPSQADSVAQAAKAGTALREELQRYRPFWMLRAAAAVQADDKTAGEQAAGVLKKLGPPDPESSSYVDVMAALNIKGWLIKRNVRTAASPQQTVEISSPNTYTGTLDDMPITGRATFPDDGTVSGSFARDDNPDDQFTFQGTNKVQGQIEITISEGDKTFGTATLTKDASGNDIVWSGDINCTDGRTIHFEFRR